MPRGLRIMPTRRPYSSMLCTIRSVPSVAGIRRHHIRSLAMQLRTTLAPRSVADVLMVLSLVLGEAVDDRRIPHNPCRGVRVPAGPRAERPIATPAQVRDIAARIRRPVDRAMVITAAYTGMRWGEPA